MNILVMLGVICLVGLIFSGMVVVAVAAAASQANHRDNGDW